MRAFIHPDLADIPLPAVLNALADPVRLRILRNLAATEGALSCQACGGPALPKSSLAHHVRVLREAGLIRSRGQGKEVVNTLRREELAARFPGLLDAVLAAAERPCPLQEDAA
jgi:DNA-binding transcriptional ArsR family regulator